MLLHFEGFGKNNDLTSSWERRELMKIPLTCLSLNYKTTVKVLFISYDLKWFEIFTWVTWIKLAIILLHVVQRQLEELMAT